MADLKSDLARNRELIETHISWVFLGSQTVLKVKRPVSLSFLDYSTLDKRRRACEAEVVLNQRLSHDVYQDVLPITRDADGVHRVASTGKVVDYAVRMKRLSDEHRADILLRAGHLGRDHILRLAGRLAAFHNSAQCSKHINAFGRVDCIRNNVLENFTQTRGLSTRFVSPQQEAHIERMQLDFLDQNGDLFEQRVKQGKIRDGHGDLRLEHVYFADDAINIIDCIEFNERFRFGDVCADLAFLSMDLVHHQRDDFAEDLLAAYAQVTSDYDLYALVDFYQGYRAYVRAKVTSLLAGDEQASEAARTAAEHQARAYYLQALVAQGPPLAAPMVIAVGGQIASGKTYVSQRLSELLHRPVVDTDRTRKHLAGAEFEKNLNTGVFTGAYDATFSARVYAEVLRRCAVVLHSQRTVIIDASFRSAADRHAARDLAHRLDVPFRFIECQVPRETALQRLRDRGRGPSISDARADLYDDFAQSWEPVTGFKPEEWFRLNNTGDTPGAESNLLNWIATGSTHQPPPKPAGQPA